MRNKVKRTLSFLLTFVMLCSLLPMTAMAKELKPGEVAASKTASYDAENHEVTITMTVEGKEASQITLSKADVVLVVDNSGSMASSVGEPCKTPSSKFENAGLGWVECPECRARYYRGLAGLLVPDFCTGEKGKEPRINTAKKVGKTFADSILSDKNDNQMAVIGFAHGEKDWFESTDAIRQKLGLTDNVTNVKNTLDEMVADGGTDYTSALQEAYDMLADRSETDRPGYVVFISDGAPGEQGESIGDSNWNGSEQAQAIKKAGYGLYTIGIALDDEADDYLESLASDNHYQNVTGRNYASELEELLKEWAEEINTVPAGTNAVMTDTINIEAFEYVEGSAKASTGTISVDNGVVTWNIGDIPAETATATFKVKPIVTPKQDTEYYTNTDVTLTYKDSNDQEQTIPKGQIGEPKVLIPGTEAEKVLLTYDANGGTGEPANEQVEKGKTATLNNTIKPTHVPEGDKEVEFQGWSADKTDIIFESADVVPEGTIIKEIAVGNDPVTVYAVWAYETAQVPETYPVQVVVYQNGNTETPVVTKTIGSYEKGAPFNVDSLNINDYYNSDYGFETTGWFNDGKWNEYKNGQNPAPLQGEITINGWTNVICMVTDKYPVHVFAVTDGDKDNAEEIYTGTALKGTDLIAFLDQNVTVPEKEGYTVDKWYNWDWYGNKYAEDTKVNGWTNAYVTYTSNDTDRTVEVTFTVNSEYGSFTDYGKGPVTFKGLPENSTEQYSVPKVTANPGYKFVGWKGQGADVIEWGADASTFGVPGLCYFAEGSNVGYASIAAVFEKEGGGHTNDYYVTVIVDGKGKVKAEDYGTVGSNETEVIIIPDVENSVKFTMEPADGWKVDDVLVDGKSVGDVDSYVLKDDVMLEGPVLKVIFEKKSSGGGGGGSHDKDDDKDKTPAKTPDALNGEDHFDYIVGDADGRVHPERNITRAEVASIFFRLLKDDVRSENLTDQNTFTDVSADAWYNVAVSTMSDMDIVFGRTDYQFDPDAYITRAEFAAIAARFDSDSYSGDDLFTDIEGHWAADQINRAAEKGWITGYPDGTFGPNRYITRAEAVTMINRVLNRMPKDKDALHEDMKVFVDNADTNAWYYLAIQEATNSHEYKKDKDGVYETWTDVLPARDWAQYLKLN